MDKFIVLSDELLKEFYKFKHNRPHNNRTIQNLLHYYKPHLTNIAQLKRIKIPIEDESLYQQLLSSDFATKNLDELAQETIFKLILDESMSAYPHINIFNDEIENNYTATYYKRKTRTKAQEHIKALLKNATNIFIYDEHITKHWNTSKRFFTELIPHKPLIIFHKERHLSSKLSEIKQISTKWKIKEDLIQNTHQNLHDRYLIIDSKIEIILTSGFDYLFDESKDFTYVVREKD